MTTCSTCLSIEYMYVIYTILTGKRDYNNNMFICVPFQLSGEKILNSSNLDELQFSKG
jgi:hypothetical protein